jgi:hypothetical protein
MRQARWGILAGTLVALVASPARADDKATRDAQARFVEGIARVKQGDFEAARLSFTEAYSVLRKPEILWNLALSEEKSGHVVDALAHFKELGRQGAAAEDSERAKKHIDTLMAQTGHLEVVAPTGAKVAVDGAPAGVTPLPEAVDVLPGKHHVVAGEKATDAEVGAGQVAHVSFTVVESGGAPAATPSTASPPPPTAPPARQPATAPQQPPPPEATHGDGSSAPVARTVTVISLGTLAVAGGVLGVVLGASSQSNANTAASLRGSDPSACTGAQPAASCGQLKDAVDAENRDHTMSVVFYGVGAALAAGAVATWFLWPTPPRSTGVSATVVPIVAPTGGGLGIVGSF